MLKRKPVKLIMVLLVLISSAYSQTRQSNQKKGVNTNSKPEIDRLAEKYKNVSSIVIYTSYGELTCFVNINTNNDGKPESIVLTCNADKNFDACVEFLNLMIHQKEKQGYLIVDGGFTNSADIRFDFAGQSEVHYLLKKRKMYCKISCWEKTINQSSDSYMNSFPQFEKTYQFEIETGDNGRKGGKTATEFEF